MKSFKKSLVFLMVLAMVLSTVAPVFAAAPTDVVGTNYETAVGNLFTLGIVSGDEAGLYNPSKNITRAEFAKIACNVLGMQSAADLSKGTTKFTDVPATHWASGFVNLASAKGLIKGYPDKTFKPEANVNYAEAITILVRALGMGDYVEKQGGTWPANYLEKASAAGMTNGVSGFDGNGSAIRGSIAQLAWNTLTAEKWGAKEYTATGITYGPLGKSLLQDQYKDYVYKDINGNYNPKTFTGVSVVGNQVATGLAADKITVKVSDQAALKAMLGVTTDTADVQVTDKSIDLNALFGKKVDLFFGKDNKVQTIRVATTDVVGGVVDTFDGVNYKIKLTDGKSYLVKSDANISVNTKSLTPATARSDFFTTVVPVIGNSTTQVSMVLDNGAVSTLVVRVADAIALSGITMKQFVVKEIKTNNDVTDVSASSSKQFNLDDVTSDLNKCVIVKNGKAATKSDIKVGDAVTYIKNTATSLYYIAVTDNKVTGTVSAIANPAALSNTGVGTRKDLTIGGKVYAMANDGKVYITKNGSLENSDVKAADEMRDFYNKAVTVTLNAAGEIIFVNGTTTSSATMQVGTITRKLVESGSDYSLKVLTPTGVTQTFTVTGTKFRALNAGTISNEVTNSANYTEPTFNSEIVLPSLLNVGKLVAYNVTSDGKISGTDLYALAANSNITDSTDGLYVNYVVAPTTIRINNTSKKVTVGATSYYAGTTTAYMNMNAAYVEKIDGWGNVVSADKTADGNSNYAAGTNLLDAAPFFIVADKDNNIKALIINKGTAGYLGSNYSYGVYIGTTSDSSHSYANVMVGSETKIIQVNTAVYAGMEKGDLIRYTVNSSNGDSILDATAQSALRADRTVVKAYADAASVTGDVYKVDKYTNNRITFKTSGSRYEEGDTVNYNANQVTIASDAVVYDCRDLTKIKVLTPADITSGMYVVADNYDHAKDYYKSVVILAY